MTNTPIGLAQEYPEGEDESQEPEEEWYEDEEYWDE